MEFFFIKYEVDLASQGLYTSPQLAKAQKTLGTRLIRSVFQGYFAGGGGEIGGGGEFPPKNL